MFLPIAPSSGLTIFITATFALFTEGVEKFNKAYEDGLFTAVLSTNLTYTPDEVKNCKQQKTHQYSQKHYQNYDILNIFSQIIAVNGMDIFVADDIIATGDSMLHLCKELKDRGCKNIFITATFALFTEGVEKFNKAYEDGLFTAVLSTNLTYTPDEVKNCNDHLQLLSNHDACRTYQG